MKPIMDKTDKILLTLFLMSLAAYLVIFLSAFWDLPLNIPPWHQGLLLYFHSIPMFFLQLLLCRLAKPHWRLFAPLMLLLVPGLVFVGSAGWAVLGWVLFLYWCTAPTAGLYGVLGSWAGGGTSTKKEIRLYNVLFPIWPLWGFPAA